MITTDLTLPQLVEITDKHKKGEIELSQFEKLRLRRLLESYAEEVLRRGQCVDLGPLNMAKSLHGVVLVCS